MAEALQWLESGVAEDPAVVPVSDPAQAWAKIRAAVEFYRPDLDADVALLAAHLEASARADINKPEIADFIEGIKREAAHQRDRWQDEHDAAKAPEDWYWLVGYLAGKALRAQRNGNVDKARHHAISTAAVLYNWHSRALLPPKEAQADGE